MFLSNSRTNSKFSLVKETIDGVKTLILFDYNERIVTLPTSFFYHSLKLKAFSLRTIEEYALHIKYYLIFLLDNEFTPGYSCDDYIRGSRALHLENYFAYLHSTGLKGATIHVRDASLKTFFDWLTTKEAGNIFSVNESPYSSGRLKTKAPHNQAVKCLTHLEFIHFSLFAFNNEFERCIAHLMFDTGLRISEVSRLRFSDIAGLLQANPEANYFPMLVHGSKGRGQNIKQRLTIISRPVLSRVWKMVNHYKPYQRYKDQNPELKNDHLLFIQRNLKSFKPGTFSKKIYRSSKTALERQIVFRSVTSHMFRHSTAMSILCSEFGQDNLDRLQLIMVMFGHNHLQSSERYGSISAPVLAELRRTRSKLDIVNRYEEAAEIYLKTELNYEID